MDRRLRALSCIVALLAACSAPQPEPIREIPPAAAPAPEAAQPVARAPLFAPAVTSDAYRRQFAERVAQTSPEIFHDTLPKMLKSIVVVDITVDRDGQLKDVAIRRSNGYKALEKVALHSVRRAGPFAAPPRSMRRSDGSANFLETFLFREDGRFQIRTLAEIQ